uniref:Uncharacterized protein n=1 Tax=Prymnesium polylepis TaxID=72548 RepID=A0A7S4I5T8_9EUKA
MAFGTGRTSIESQAFALWDAWEPPEKRVAKSHQQPAPLKTWNTQTLKPSPSATSIQNSKELRESVEFKQEMNKIKQRQLRAQSARSARVLRESPIG